MESFSYSGLEEIVAPLSVREISAKAFYGCEQLRSVALNEGLEKLGAREVICGKEYEGQAFYKSAVESVILPSTLKRIEAETFSWCRALKSVRIPDGVEYIGRGCF